MKYDKEATKLNAINLLSKLATIDQPSRFPAEEMAHLSMTSQQHDKSVKLMNKHFLELSIKDQILVARLAVIIGEIASSLVTKYSLDEMEDEDE